jgi:hypothetical protein
MLRRGYTTLSSDRGWLSEIYQHSDEKQPSEDAAAGSSAIRDALKVVLPTYATSSVFPQLNLIFTGLGLGF